MNVLRFLKRLPFYWHFEVHYQERCRRRMPHESLVYTPGVHFLCPDDAIAYSVFQYHLFTPWQRREIADFLELAQGCTHMVDAGASAGIMSLMFAASRPVAEVLAVEPDPRSLRALKQASELNAKSGRTWHIADCALSDNIGETEISMTGFGANIGGGGGRPTKTVTLATLASVCQDHDFTPDLVKLDIEGFEHEVILSSVELFRRTRARIHLELHLGMIRGRGADPLQAIRQLHELGYREKRLGRSWSRWEGDARRILASSYPIAHYSLAPESFSGNRACRPGDDGVREAVTR